MKKEVNDGVIELTQGDITESVTDAIVNAANSQLILGAGVAGAIAKNGGPVIQEECNAIGHCPVGGAVITTGGNLPASHVIHAVGPRQGEGDEEQKLKQATLSSLDCAEKNGLTSITFPAISTGVFGFPIEDCAHIMLTATQEYLQQNTQLKLIRFTLFDAKGFKTFQQVLGNLR